MKFDKKQQAKGLKRLYLASLNSARGFRWLSKNESAFRQELLLLALAVPLVLLLELTFAERLMLIASVLFVILVEVINTAIEVVVDRIGTEIHPLSGLAKDLGSGAVFVSILIATCIWLMVLV